MSLIPHIGLGFMFAVRRKTGFKQGRGKLGICPGVRQSFIVDIDVCVSVGESDI